MNIEKAIKKYLELEDFFSPEYDRENEVLTEFKKNSPELSESQIAELVEILENDSDLNKKFFVADLLYLYDRIDDKFFNPLIGSAIDFQDPSFNRIFLKPCIQNFGLKKVAEKLTDEFKNTDLKSRVSISNLVYWLRPHNNGEADSLHAEIINRANETDNLIELYFYNLNYSGKIKSTKKIPNDAKELIDVVNGDSELEYILFDQLKWKRQNDS